MCSADTRNAMLPSVTPRPLAALGEHNAERGQQALAVHANDNHFGNASKIPSIENTNAMQVRGALESRQGQLHGDEAHTCSGLSCPFLRLQHFA